MAINKKTREAVYQKYGGRCAYCGRAITYKDMQVDHFRPLRVWNEADGAADDISNLMPACRMCNHYKRANSLEVFRRYIAEIPRKLRSDYIYKIGVAYGNVVENEKPIAFFFETQETKTASAAASKLRRKIDGKNPTPKTLEECWEDLKKEIGDVMNSIDALTEQDPQNYHEFMSECGEYAEPKMERWLFRLNEQKEEHA